jgi:hypothetical protein
MHFLVLGSRHTHTGRVDFVLLQIIVNDVLFFLLDRFSFLLYSKSFKQVKIHEKKNKFSI